VLAEAEQVHGAIAAGEEERENGLVRLQRVAVRAGKDEVVAAVIGSFAAAGRHVVEGDGVGMDTTLAVRTDGAVAIEEPLTRVCVSRATCGQRRVLLVCSRGATAPARGWTGATQWYKGLEGD
jgi:hypothetical protein